MEVERIPDVSRIDVRSTQSVINATMCQRSSNSHHGQMCRRVVTKISGSVNHSRRVENYLAVDRPILHDKADMAVIRNDLFEMRMQRLAGGTGVVEKLDNRQVAIRVSEDWLRGVVRDVY